ncbi:MAG: zinc ribbon domain-containing protein [Chloroflexi bacterium]|nr:zinc ribbon domain-containing protein [Chloroflexota bacterium]
MRKLILLSLLFVLFVLPLNVAAQESILIDTMLVQLWPEYDRDEMLVIYRIQLSADLNYPVAISLPMPTAAGEPNAVAVPGDAGNLVLTPYEMDEQGEWTFVNFTVETPIVQFEYYDPGLSTSSDERQYQYLWEGQYAVEAFSVQVQQPVGASQMQTSPGLDAPVQGPDSLQYHNGDLGSASAGQEVTLDISYTKAADTLSAEAVSQTGADDPGVSVVANSIDWVRWVGWGLGILGVGILGFAGYRWLNPVAQKDTFRQGRRGTASKKTRSSINVFCHNCGMQAKAGDKFCRECGTALRL